MISMKFKKLLLILLVLSILPMTGCWNSREINTLAIAICIGIDKTPNGYMLTHQVLNTKAIASKKATAESAIILYTDEGTDLFESLRRTTTQCPRKIYYSQLKMIVLSEEVAEEGLENILDFLSRDHAFRTDFYFVVAKGTTANKVLSVLTPLEPVPGIEMYNSLKTSSDAWAPTKAVKIVELVNSVISEGKNPVLTGVEITGDKFTTGSLDALKQSNVANRLKFAGLGVFKKDKLIGWLDEIESKDYNYITGNVKSSAGYVQYDEPSKISYEVISSKTKTKAYILNGKPAIKVEIEIEINIATVTGDIDISKEENLKKLNKKVELKANTSCNSTVNKVKEDLKTDIFGFGEVIHRAYPELWKKMKDDWNNRFVNLPVNVVFHVKAKQLGQITKPFFMKGND